MDIKELISQANKFTTVAHGILAKQESSKSRVILLEDTYEKLESLSIKQDDLLRQALRCVENELYRAAHVMSWAALFDFIEETLQTDNFIKINTTRPKWNVKSIYDLREGFPESQIIDAMKDAKIISKNDAKGLHGLLNRRNECAHPSDYYPNLNTTLGYISEILQRLELLRKKIG